MSLHPYHYVAKKGNETRDLTFYAPNRKTANLYALSWCRKRHYRVFRRKPTRRANRA